MSVRKLLSLSWLERSFWNNPASIAGSSVDFVGLPTLWCYKR